MLNFKELDLTKPYEVWNKTIEDNWELLTNSDSAAKNNRTLVGRYINHQYADGYAIYLIVKENKTTVRIEVCTGLGDDWVLPAWGAKATINKKDALRFINYRDGIDKLFSRKVM
jgi:hypothetical protein